MILFMTRCVNCDQAGPRVIAMPFTSRGKRKAWIDAHEQATEHRCTTWEEYRHDLTDRPHRPDRR